MPSSISDDYLSSSYLSAIFAVAVFAVLTHWNVWDDGVFSMGWNTSVTWLALGAMLLRSNDQIQMKYDWVWLVPLGLLALSFGLYQNPWLKLISFLMMPITVGVFVSFGHVKPKRDLVWGVSIILKLISNTFKVIPTIFPSFRLISVIFFSKFEEGNLSVFKRVIRALSILLPLMFVILLLLSSADENFNLMIGRCFELLSDFLNWSIVAKIVCVFLLSGLMLAVVAILRREHNVDHGFRVRLVDDLIAAIVLMAILFVYIAFLSLQLDYLMVNKLPIEFADTERLVKSGFWQLFILSIINVGLFYWVYKNTGSVAQWILRFYLIASALILLSAGWRMGLYVFYYGFSYEKFFASYTTLYALVLFGFLGWAVFAKSRKDIAKYVCISSLWMFSIATILPVERIIFSSNLALSQHDGSRIDLFHLTNLSVDVLSSGAETYRAGKFSNNQAWNNWLRRTASDNCGRPWYESNLSLELNCLGVSLDEMPEGNWKSY